MSNSQAMSAAKITNIKVPLHEYVWLHDIARLHDSFHGSYDCKGGRPCEAGLVCPHCGADDPRRECLKPISGEVEKLTQKLIEAKP